MDTFKIVTLNSILKSTPKSTDDDISVVYELSMGHSTETGLQINKENTAQINKYT